jgi:hypothetical protein
LSREFSKTLKILWANHAAADRDVATLPSAAKAESSKEIRLQNLLLVTRLFRSLGIKPTQLRLLPSDVHFVCGADEIPGNDSKRLTKLRAAGT